MAQNLKRNSDQFLVLVLGLFKKKKKNGNNKNLIGNNQGMFFSLRNTFTFYFIYTKQCNKQLHFCLHVLLKIH